MEVCSIYTYWIHYHGCCCWTHCFYETLVSVLTNALKPCRFLVFLICLYEFYLIENNFVFVLRMIRKCKQEIKETDESQIGMSSIISNGTGLECIL